MRRIVDLPQPDSPSSATISPGRTARSIFSSTRSGLPLGSVNSWETSRVSQRAAVLTVPEAPMLARSSLTPLAPQAGRGVLLFVEREAFLGQPIAIAPHRAVEGDDDDRHHQRAGG